MNIHIMNSTNGLSDRARQAFGLALFASLIFVSGQAVALDSLEASDAFLWLYAMPDWIPSVLLIAALMGLSWSGFLSLRRWLPAAGQGRRNNRIGYYAVVVAAIAGILLAPFVTNTWQNYLAGSINSLPPSAAGNASSSTVTLAWAASTAANVGGYIVYYGTSSGNYTASVDVGNSTSYTLTGLQTGTAYYFAVSAYDTTRAFQSRYSNEASVNAQAAPTANFTPSQASGNAPLAVTFTPATTGAITSWQWSFGDGTTNSGTTSTVPTAIKSYGSVGTYNVSLTVTGPGGSVTNTLSNQITVTTPSVTSTAGDSTGTTATTATTATTGNAAGNTSGLVAAYGFDEVNGSYAEDASGSGNYGTITGAVRVVGGRFGNALKFSGTSSSPNWVTVQNSASLPSSSAMTLEAWVYPTTWVSGTSTVVMKQQPNAGSYGEAYLLAANNGANQPMSAILAGSEVAIGGNMQIPLNQWTHLATTYDGQYQYLYVNGVLVSTLPQTGAVNTSSGVLQIGGNSLWGGYFQGYIDEVRIYNRALTNDQIISDSTSAISVSNPLKFVAGDTNVESTPASLLAGTAQAFKITPATSQTLADIQVYLDAGSSATKLQVAIYTSTTDGHPRSLWGSVGILTALQAGAWNSASLYPLSLSAGQSYWIVILGTGGTLNLRGQPGTGTSVTESSASSTLTSLPNNWTTGGIATGGAVSVYGSGY